MTIRKLALSLYLCCIALAGCSSKPDVSDIADGLKEGWGLCKGVKLTDLKKTNGVDRGGNYEMAISYKLEIVNDLTAEQAWNSTTICGDKWDMYKMLTAYGKMDNKYGHSLKAGDVINVNDVFNMVKSENGWIKQ
jgi:hypothetical protein